MTRFLTGRFLQAVISIFGLVTVVFFMMRLTGDPVARMIPLEAPPEVQESLRARFGLDKPLIEQYWIFLREMVGGNLGQSLYFQRDVTGLLGGRILPSLQLAVASMVFAFAVSLPLGVYAAVHRAGKLDFGARSFAILGGSVPSFLSGLVFIKIFAVELDWFPIGGRDGVLSIVLPAGTLGWGGSAAIMRLTRSSMLEVLDSDYVNLARIKGVREWAVIWRHALKNALLPVVTYSAVIFAAVVGGALVTEYVFAWPGLASLLVQAVQSRDFPLIQGAVILIGVFFILANFLADLAYAWLDPRIRFSR